MKKLYSLLFIFALFVCMPLVAKANDLSEEAVELQRNDRTDFSIPEKSDLISVNGPEESKVYKIALGINKSEKLTLVSRKTFDVEIFDPNGDRIVQKTGFGDEGNRQVEFETRIVGDYYIQIKPAKDGRNNYPYSIRTIVGEPVYLYANPVYRVDLRTSSITSRNTTSAIQSFDLTNVSSIPDDAILTGFTIGGTETNRNLVSLYSIKRSLRPNSAFSWIDATFPLYSPNHLDAVPKHAQIKVKQPYYFRFSASFNRPGTYTLKPFVLISYKREMK